jgi:hypothetical protein
MLCSCILQVNYSSKSTLPFTGLQKMQQCQVRVSPVDLVFYCNGSLVYITIRPLQYQQQQQQKQHYQNNNKNNNYNNKTTITTDTASATITTTTTISKIHLPSNGSHQRKGFVDQLL